MSKASTVASMRSRRRCFHQLIRVRGTLYSQAPQKVNVRLGWQPSGRQCRHRHVHDPRKLFEGGEAGYGNHARMEDLCGRAALNGRCCRGSSTSICTCRLCHSGARPPAYQFYRSRPLRLIANALMVKPNSPINDVSMLPGKTVACRSEPRRTTCWLPSLRRTLENRSGDGHQTTNMPVPEAIKVPAGIDVAPLGCRALHWLSLDLPSCSSTPTATLAGQQVAGHTST